MVVVVDKKNAKQKVKIFLSVFLCQYTAKVFDMLFSTPNNPLFYVKTSYEKFSLVLILVNSVVTKS